MPRPAEQVDLRVQLEGIAPPIWRQVRVRASTTLSKFHRILQVVMGWQDCHLHMFEIGERRYGLADPDFPDLCESEGRKRLANFISEPGASLVYRYDFGDDWAHQVIVQGVSAISPGSILPVCTGGARACPPEDVGGPWGYQACLAALRDPSHKEHDSYTKWVPKGFDPERFDVNAANVQLGRAFPRDA